MDDVESRSTALINAWKEERDFHFSQSALSIAQEMNGRGMLNSSETVNKVYILSESELSTRASGIFDIIVRAHTSAEGKITGNLPNRLSDIFASHLMDSMVTLENQRNRLVGGIAGACLSKNMLRTDSLQNVYDSLTNKYRVEIDMYIDGLKKPAGANLTTKLINSFLSRPYIAVVAVAALAIGALATLSGSLQSISESLRLLLE